MNRLAKEPEFEGSVWKYWDHHLRWYSIARARTAAIRLRGWIDQEWAFAEGYEDVTLIGHSLGGLLVRQAYLLAVGIDPELPQGSPWSKHVSRLILFAAVNRGLNLGEVSWKRVVRWMYWNAPLLQRLLAYDLIRSSAFITNLHIEWIRYFDTLAVNAPVVVQLLGSEDGIVTRSDNIDLEQFPSAYHTTIPDATHGDLYRLDTAKNPEGRYALIRDAIVRDAPQLADEKDVRKAPQRVVFVLHGIKSSNTTWVQDTVEIIKSRGLAAIGSTYGYFSALRFALPVTRRKNLEWFQDEYSQYPAHNPKAEFNFIGHSNGTYLLGESLKRIPGMKFNRVVLAGSVLPNDYPWRERYEAGQFASLRNERSNKDFPVGVLCSALRGFFMRDVGTGGFEGFFGTAGLPIQEVFWHDGGHSTPLAPNNLEYLAEFVAAGQEKKPDLDRSASKLYLFLSHIASRLAPFLLLLVVFGAAWWVTHPVFSIVKLAILLGIILVLVLVFDAL